MTILKLRRVHQELPITRYPQGPRGQSLLGFCAGTQYTQPMTLGVYGEFDTVWAVITVDAYHSCLMSYDDRYISDMHIENVQRDTRAEKEDVKDIYETRVANILRE